MYVATSAFWFLIDIRSLKEPTILVQTVVDGLQVYFDKALGSNLLYRFERPQYSRIRREYWTGPHVTVGLEKEMSSIYGAEHLLRMLGNVFYIMRYDDHFLMSRYIVSLPQLIALAGTSLDPESIILIRDYTNELMTCAASFFAILHAYLINSLGIW